MQHFFLLIICGNRIFVCERQAETNNRGSIIFHKTIDRNTLKRAEKTNLFSPFAQREDLQYHWKTEIFYLKHIIEREIFSLIMNMKDRIRISILYSRSTNDETLEKKLNDLMLQ